ncbi:potassium channel regulatory protein [Protopterus annectens]|uniref:potassium channel regulatory protein n=1 Tax=Protopterus annectens TaxID=7888 RepID=UPI001CFB5940|nr:potassium channel regulatory protein [Protopterus annectens]
MSNQEVVNLNVGGVKYATLNSTLRKYPGSKLARLAEGNDADFRLINGQVFVDRDGDLFRYFLDYLRTGQLSLPSDFSEYERLIREADFYELHSLANVLSQETPRQRLEIMEVRFSIQESHSFFRIFCSSSSTIEMLAGRISLFAEQTGQSWGYPHLSQKPMAPIPLKRPSHHDLVFHCGTDYSVGEEFAAR